MNCFNHYRNKISSIKHVTEPKIISTFFINYKIKTDSLYHKEELDSFYNQLNHNKTTNIFTFSIIHSSSSSFYATPFSPSFLLALFIFILPTLVFLSFYHFLYPFLPSFPHSSSSLNYSSFLLLPFSLFPCFLFFSFLQPSFPF